MKAFLIDADARSITPLDLPAGLDSVRQAIGYASVDSDEIDDNGDRLFFDEECFIRQPGAPRFKVDNLAPVAGKGVVVGSADPSKLQDAVIDLAALTRRVSFIA